MTYNSRYNASREVRKKLLWFRPLLGKLHNVGVRMQQSIIRFCNAKFGTLWARAPSCSRGKLPGELTGQTRWRQSRDTRKVYVLAVLVSQGG
jgi:hypothetical protein